MSKQAKLPKEAAIKSKPDDGANWFLDYIFSRPVGTNLPKKTK